MLVRVIWDDIFHSLSCKKRTLPVHIHLSLGEIGSVYPCVEQLVDLIWKSTLNWTVWQVNILKLFTCATWAPNAFLACCVKQRVVMRLNIAYKSSLIWYKQWGKALWWECCSTYSVASDSCQYFWLILCCFFSGLRTMFVTSFLQRQLHCKPAYWRA